MRLRLGIALGAAFLLVLPALGCKIPIGDRNIVFSFDTRTPTAASEVTSYPTTTGATATVAAPTASAPTSSPRPASTSAATATTTATARAATSTAVTASTSTAVAPAASATRPPAPTATRTATTAAAPSPVAAAAALISKVTMAEGTQGDAKDPVNPTATFARDATFHAVVAVANAPDGTTFTATWYATDVGSAAPANTLIDSASVVTSGTRNIDFTLKPATTWPVGTYRVEIRVNDQLGRTVEFSVK